MSVKEISRKRKGTVYQTVVDLGRDPQGRRVQRRVTARTKRNLREKVDALRAERRNGFIVTRGRETLGALADRWLSSKRDACAHRTYASYVDIVESFIRPQLGHLTLRSLSPEDVERALNTWRVAQRRDHRKHSKTVPALLSNRTLRYIATVLRTLCNYGVRMRAIATNPAEFVALPRSEDYEATVLPIDRFAQLLQFARTWHDGDLSLHFLLAAAAGLRRGELCALQWGDVDLQHATITVRHAIEVRRDGSGIGIKEPKGKKSRRLSDSRGTRASAGGVARWANVAARERYRRNPRPRHRGRLVAPRSTQQDHHALHRCLRRSPGPSSRSPP
uniref:Phage integrase family protein n=1 Tax=mine drainage metagenome TaxID=410659 RepID=E6PHX3_9ZZZZ